MKFLKEWSEWNPVLNQEVLNFIEDNKEHLKHLWDDSETEEENIKFLTNYFTQYPEEMNSSIKADNIKIPRQSTNIRIYAPVLQNIS